MQLLFAEVVFKLFKDKFFVLSTSTPWGIRIFSSTKIDILRTPCRPGAPLFTFPMFEKELHSR